jgi:hypothetical protein
MNLQELKAEAWNVARVDVDEADETKLWGNLEMNRYVNRAYRHIARETRCIRDAVTPEVCSIPLAPPVDLAALTAQAATSSIAAQDLLWYNTPTSWLYQQLVAPYIIPLHPTILDILEVKWSLVTWRLMKVSVTKWQVNPCWEQTLSSLPTEYATDYSNNSLVLNTRTKASDTLRLVVTRMPLTELKAELDEPEFRSQYHDFLLNGVLAQMYSKQDSQALDIKKADQYAADFARDIDDIKQQEMILDQRLKVNFSMSAFR